MIIGHGAVDTLSPDRNNPALIKMADAQSALQHGRYHYLALEDRHSFTEVGTSGRIYYCGTHEAYDFGEIEERARSLLAALVRSERRSELVVIPDSADF